MHQSLSASFPHSRQAFGMTCKLYCRLSLCPRETQVLDYLYPYDRPKPKTFLVQEWHASWRPSSWFCPLQAESSEHTKPTGLLEILPDINECFMHDDVESIVEALEARDAQWAQEARKKMSG